MKYIAFLFLMICTLLSGCSDLDNNKIYFFTKTNCPYCQKAEKYISEKYPNLSIEYKNVSSNQNRALFAKCARKGKIPQNKWGTPLICKGDNVFLGWSEETQKSFDKLVKELNK